MLKIGQGDFLGAVGVTHIIGLGKVDRYDHGSFHVLHFHNPLIFVSTSLYNELEPEFIRYFIGS